MERKGEKKKEKAGYIPMGSYFVMLNVGYRRFFWAV